MKTNKKRRTTKKKKLQPNPLLKRERELRGWSQDDVAGRIGTSKLTVHRWETGHNKPDPYYRQKLCELFAKTAAELGFVDMGMAIPSWNVPIQQNLFFRGRDTLIEGLHAKFVTSASKIAIPKFALSGLPGIGKTQIAVEYAYRYKKEYSAVLWLQADSKETLFGEMVRLVTVLHLPIEDEPDQESVVQAVKQWFNSNIGWLLILDNVIDPDMIAKELSLAGCGHMLLTTQVQATGAFATRIDVEELVREEGTIFLLRRSTLIKLDETLDSASPANRAGARDIVEEMGGLPLALDQAAAYIEETKCGVAAYLDRYQVRRAQLLQRRGKRKSGHPASVVTTFSLAFERIEQANPASAELLCLCAFLYAEDIPIDLFPAGTSVLGDVLGPIFADQIKLDEAIAELLNYSILQHLTVGTPHHTARGLRIHRLVQAVIQDEMNEQLRRQWAERAVCIVERALSSVQFDALQHAERYILQAQTCAALIEQWDFVFIEATQLLRRTGRYLQVHARYDQAERLLLQVLAIHENPLAQEQPTVAIEREVATDLNDLAILYDNQGKYTLAESYFERALKINERILEPEDPVIATSLNNLAHNYQMQGKWDAAERFCQRALDSVEKTMGPENPLVANSLTTLAVIYRWQQRQAEAEPLFRRALEIREKTLESGSLEVGASLTGLAANYIDQKKYLLAEPLVKRALAIFKKALGSNHPYVAINLTTLAGICESQGKYDEAERLYHRALKIYAQVPLIDHPDVASTLTRLAALYEKQGKYPQAEPLFVQALERLERCLGPEHRDMIHPLYNYADLLIKMGRKIEAMPYVARAYALKLKYEGKEDEAAWHRDIAAYLQQNLADVERMLGREDGRVEH